MKILLVGGTGMIGAHCATHLKSLGHDVTLAARNAPSAGTDLVTFPFIKGSYLDDDFTVDQLEGFDALVFGAGNDIRHIPEGADPSAHYERANSIGVPKFFALAREAGIPKAVYIGSYYPQAAPQLIETNDYVRSRHLADEGIRALTSPSFSVTSVNAPIVVGSIPGLAVSFFDFYIRYAMGELEGIPFFAPPGGANCISTQSLAEAVAGALERGEAGKAYLVGDENLAWQTYIQMFFDAVGSDVQLPVIDQEHPLFPDATMFAGRGGTIYYDPDPAETALLGYRRNDIRNAVEFLVGDFRARNGIR